MRDLVIVGAGGHGREVLDVLEAVNAADARWNFLGFLDDGAGNGARLRRRNASIIGEVRQLRHLDADFVMGIGDSDARSRVSALAAKAGRRAAVLVHPAATLGSDVQLGPGVVVCAGARLTTNVRLGQHTHVNVNGVVSHDCRLGEFVTLSPGALVNGSVTLEDHVLLGTAAVVTPGRTVGARTWVGAGAVVTSDLSPGVVASGVPARVRRQR
jgi:sugar O-acyltransferase (sialic acid O-acetyltransferase NeuD family)